MSLGIDPIGAFFVGVGVTGVLGIVGVIARDEARRYRKRLVRESRQEARAVAQKEIQRHMERWHDD